MKKILFNQGRYVDLQLVGSEKRDWILQGQHLNLSQFTSWVCYKIYFRPLYPTDSAWDIWCGVAHF